MKTKTRITFWMLSALDLLEDAIFLASRPGMTRLSRYWGYAEMRAGYRAFERWQQLEYVEKVEEGEEALYRITEKGRKLLVERRVSAARRDRPWDEQWRMIVFDFPETARKARDAFRRTLRHQRMGCLQKSVWITPDPVIADWKRLLEEMKLTEWVLLFESAELGPVDDREIASRVWGLDVLARSYDRYLAEFRALPQRLRGARASGLTGELGRFVRKETERYFEILQDDPLLPGQLLPKNFPGLGADSLHREVRSQLRECLFESRPG